MLFEHKIAIGLSETIEKKVMAGDTAAGIGSGTLDFLLSTPAIIEEIINISAKMLNVLLPEGYITVGRYIELTHLKPTFVGEEITITVTVENITGNSIRLSFVINDTYGLIGRGTHERIIASNEKLLKTAFNMMGSD